MTELGTWTGEAPDAAEDAPRAEVATSAPGSWLPPSVARAQAFEDVAEARAARAERRARVDAAEAAHDGAVGAYMAGAAMRGEVVSAADVASGNIGRSMADVFGDAIAAADHEDARQAAKAHREAGREPEHVMVRSDGWPESSYELDRQLRRAGDLHRDRVMFEARLASRQGRAAGHIEALRRNTSTSLAREVEQGTITRYAPTPVCDRCGYIRCECR